MKRTFLLFSLLLMGTAAFSTTYTITNSGFTFSPATITISLGDDVFFSLESIHNAVEVSLETWNANGNTPLSGGFQTSFSGGSVPAGKLGTGTHYYVCQPHAFMGMKGQIIVENATGIDENRQIPDYVVYPVPAVNLLTIRTNINLSGNRFYITNLTGKLVSTGTLDETTTPVDISQFLPGIYMVQIAGQRKQTTRFVKN